MEELVDEIRSTTLKMGPFGILVKLDLLTIQGQGPWNRRGRTAQDVHGNARPETRPGGARCGRSGPSSVLSSPCWGIKCGTASDSSRRHKRPQKVVTKTATFLCVE